MLDLCAEDSDMSKMVEIITFAARVSPTHVTEGRTMVRVSLNRAELEAAIQKLNEIERGT